MNKIQSQGNPEYMRLAITLAKKGRGFTNPNPMVGAVIVKEGRIIGQGYHERCGSLHAERNALASLTESAEGADIYVTLEPCCHYGKTPPCTEALIEHKISRVFIGSRDPNPLVAGKGAARLKAQGIEVVEDFLRDECDALNPVFFHYITTKMPYVILKYAMTADGKIATKTGASKWITGEPARKRVQEMRASYMAIMAGIGTVLADDPLLTVRLESLKSPLRILCDSRLRIPLDSQIVKTAKDYPTMVACAVSDSEKIRALEAQGVEVLTLPLASMQQEAETITTDQAQRSGSNPPSPNGQMLCGRTEKSHPQVDLKQLLHLLGSRGIDSVFVEGGGTLNDSLRAQNLIDQIDVFLAPKLFGGKDAKSPVEGAGVDAVSEASLFRCVATEQIGEDVLLTYVKNKES